MGSGVDKSQLARGTLEVLLGEAEMAAARLQRRARRLCAAAGESGPDIRGGAAAHPDGRPRDAAAPRARAGARRLRRHPHRLPAGSQHADRELARRGRQRAHSDAMRVLRARGPVGSARHGRADPPGRQPAARDRGYPAHHVRSAEQPRERGQRAAPHAFRRQGFPHGHPPQHPPRGGAVVRPAGVVSRQGVARRAGIPRARGRDDPARGGSAGARRRAAAAADVAAGGEAS